MPERCSYDYAVVRVVPSEERAEFINVGIILHAKAHGVLAIRIDLDEARLRAMAPSIDVAMVRAHLEFDAAHQRGWYGHRTHRPTQPVTALPLAGVAAQHRHPDLAGALGPVRRPAARTRSALRSPSGEMSSLVASSLDVIERNQASTGAFVAAPGYATYAYSWLRDGSFIAAALDAYGRRSAATAFHTWVARTIERYGYKVERLEASVDATGKDGGSAVMPLDDSHALHTRFTVEGVEGSEDWGNFQLDGYGFWLTCVARHLLLTGTDPAPFLTAIDLVRRYLALSWEYPCYDAWEEYPTHRHMATWAAVSKGLAASDQLGLSVVPIGTSGEILRRLVSLTQPDHVLKKFVPGDASGIHAAAAEAPPRTGVTSAGHERIGRALTDDDIDGSALLVLGDFGPFSPTSNIARSTIGAIDASLVHEGGVHRYLEDEFYGGGLWVVLGGARAVVLASMDPQAAAKAIEWIESTADPQGYLPEQVSVRLRKPERMAAWVDHWGPPAQPLLWSHAMYLLAVDAMTKAASSRSSNLT